MMNYERPGIEHTESTLKRAFTYAFNAGIGHVVVASTTGYKAKKVLAMPSREAFEIVVVTHNRGFDGKGGRQFPGIFAGCSRTTASRFTRAPWC